MRILIVLVAICAFTLPASAQEKDSFFADYSAYANYTDRMVMARNIAQLIERMGGRDEYTKEELQNLSSNFERLYPNDFTDSAVFRKEDLGGGLMQEGRMYWIEDSYVYFYIALHQREDALVVVNMYFNSSLNEVMARF